MWTFIRERPGHGKAPEGTVSEKILLQSCYWSVDLKVWWKRAEQLALAIAGWNATYTWHYESALPLSTQPFKLFPKPAPLQCYENTSWGEFDLCKLKCNFQCPFHSLVILLHTTFSHSLTPSPSLSEWTLCDQLLSLALKHRRTGHTENISTQRGKAEICLFFILFQNVLLLSWRLMFNARWHWSASHVPGLQLHRKNKCQISFLKYIFHVGKK